MITSPSLNNSENSGGTDFSRSAFTINRFRNRIEGPELIFEDLLTSKLPSMFQTINDPLWAGTSLSVGAGRPDIMVVTFRPNLLKLTKTGNSEIQIMSYLRSVNMAKVSTIAERTLQPIKSIKQSLETMIENDTVQKIGSSFKLNSEWRNILPEIICIEVKVSHWKRAITQASRNQVFSHKSYMALPSDLANKMENNHRVKELGIGIIGILTDGRIIIQRKAKRNQPKVWFYYYQIAKMIARYETEGQNGVPSSTGRC